MNYLAHLHIADHTHTSFSGNFLGDFVKGDPDGQFPPNIVQGIRLHRHVDSFVDRNAHVLAAKACFPQPLRRYAPIALDMFWDHFLAVHWQQFHSLSLSEFCVMAEQKIQAETADQQIILPARFQRVNGWVWQDKWLESYQRVDNIQYALTRMATRSERMAPLAQTGQVLTQHYQAFNDIFPVLYNEVLQEVEAFLAAVNNKKETD